MTEFRLVNSDTGATVGSVRRAGNSIDRTVGLLRTRRVLPGRGMWFDNCSAIHTVLMGCPIDVIFLDSESRVMRIVERVSPNRLIVTPHARVTVELGAGTAEKAKLTCGDRLMLEESVTEP